MGRLTDTHHTLAVELENTEVDLNLASIGRDRERSPPFDMRPHYGPVIDVAEHVTVEHEEVFRQPLEELDDRSHRAQRRILLGIVDLDAPLRAVTHDSPD